MFFNVFLGVHHAPGFDMDRIAAITSETWAKVYNIYTFKITPASLGVVSLEIKYTRAIFQNLACPL